jgi:perosamine synthetase
MKKFSPKNDLPLMDTEDGIVLFRPHIPQNALPYIKDVLNSRWIGQGPKVDEFEQKFKKYFNLTYPNVAVGSGTDALHLAYVLANLQPGDEVLSPLFTCTATNTPLLSMGVKIRFIDIDKDTLNISIKDLRNKINEKTKAIICVHYGGLPCDLNEIKEIADQFNIPVIEDAAHALGAEYDKKPVGNISDFTMFSFQAIKHITTADGGMLTIKNNDLLDKSKRIRWFGISRKDKQLGIWDNDITEVGYKYTMTDLSAALGLAALEEFDFIIEKRRGLYKRYCDNLAQFKDIKIVDDFKANKKHACWLFTILANERKSLQKKLRELGIESGQTHFRNDRYTVFNDKNEYPNMDEIDDKYLILPLHTHLDFDQVDYICDAIKSGW